MNRGTLETNGALVKHVLRQLHLPPPLTQALSSGQTSTTPLLEIFFITVSPCGGAKPPPTLVDDLDRPCAHF